MLFKNKRLDKLFKPIDGKRLQIVTGHGIEDIFFLGDVLGSQRLNYSLDIIAKKQSYEMIVSLDHSGNLKFSSCEMEELFQKTTTLVTQPRPGETAKKAFQPKRKVEMPNTAESSSNASPVPESLHEATESSFRNALCKIGNFFKSGRKTIAIVNHPEELWFGDSFPAIVATSLKQLANLASTMDAHVDSRVIAIVKPGRKDDFLTVIDHVATTQKFRIIHEIENPDKTELKAFLERFCLQNSVSGAHGKVLAMAFSRGWMLHNLHEAVRKVLLFPEKDRIIDSALTVEDSIESPDKVKEELDNLVGLKEIKKQVERLSLSADRQGKALQEGYAQEPPNTHMLFLGNPGTGKTEVARLIGRLLRAVGLRANGEFVEISRTDIASEYNSGECIQKMKGFIDRANGGVLFVDEAYLLADGEWLRGALETLMKEMEDKRATLTVIFAGYEEQMQRLWQVNPGFKSRIPENNWFRFPDYSIAELVEIFERMAIRKFGNIDDSVVKAATLFITAEYKRGRCGNARGIRNLLEEVAHRVNEDFAKTVSAKHIPEPVKFNQSQFDKKFAELVEKYPGWSKLSDFLKRVARQARRCDESEKPFKEFLHCRFVGSPGTGKTTAAREMGAIFHAMGLLSRGHVHEINPIRDLQSQYVGEFSQRIKDCFDRARGGILFVDEAYQLANSQQDIQILHQFVQIITEPDFSDVIVIFAGYREQINTLLQANPGLESRMPNEIEFDNMPIEALLKIFHKKMDENDLIICEEDRSRIDDLVSRRIQKESLLKNYANVRTLERMISEIQDMQSMRVEETAAQEKFRVLPEDIGMEIHGTTDINAILNDFNAKFVGLETVKRYIHNLVVKIQIGNRPGGSALNPIRLKFIGNPGTGKTSVARELGKIFHELGVMPKGDVFIETRGIELKASYVGQTQKKIVDLFENACGGMLFIDEIYALAASSHTGGDVFAQEAIDTLVGQISLPQNQQTVVIIAGYREKMKQFMDCNEGLSRRFPVPLDFPNYTPEECFEILRRIFVKSGTSSEKMLEDSCLRQVLFDAFLKAIEKPHFGNAGMIEVLAERIFDARNDRLINAGVDFSKNNYSLCPIVEDFAEATFTWLKEMS